MGHLPRSRIVEGEVPIFLRIRTGPRRGSRFQHLPYAAVPVGMAKRTGKQGPVGVFSHIIGCEPRVVRIDPELHRNVLVKRLAVDGWFYGRTTPISPRNVAGIRIIKAAVAALIHIEIEPARGMKPSGARLAA